MTAAAAPSAAPPQRPIPPVEAEETFLAAAEALPPSARLVYRPAILAQAELHFANARVGCDEWQHRRLLATPPTGRSSRMKPMQSPKLPLLCQPVNVLALVQ